MTSIARDDRLAQLQAQLGPAQASAKELNAEVAKAKRKADRADGRVTDLKEEIARLQIEIWGTTPDWSLLLKSETMTMYYALEAHLARLGLVMSHEWTDTRERVVAIAMNSGEIGAVARNAAAVRLLVPHMKKHAGGSIWFKINSRDQSACLWTLRITPKKDKYELVQEHFCNVEQRLPFATLEDALTHVQRHLWFEDILDQQPVALIEHTEAVA